MPYSKTGTPGPDTLDLSGQTGPGQILGLAGPDVIKTGKGPVTVDGGADEDMIILQAGNTGVAMGGSENDYIASNGDIGAMALYGNAGADTIEAHAAATLTVIGGDNAVDGNDPLVVISINNDGDYVLGNGGNDTLLAGTGNDTYVGGVGDDWILEWSGGGNDLVMSNQGNDYISVWGGNDTVFAGTGNDSVEVGGADHPLYYLEEGADTLAGGGATGGMTVHGGNDSWDGNDSIVTGSGDDLVYGKGGSDTIVANEGANTVMGGGGLVLIGIIPVDGSDSIVTGSGADLIYGNGGNDTINANDGSNTVSGGGGNDSIQCAGSDLLFGDEGNDTIHAGNGFDTLNGGDDNDSLLGGWTGTQLLVGGEGNDTLYGTFGRDTLTGGSGGDVFYYGQAATEDCDFGAISDIFSPPPVEAITDLNFDEDRIRVLGTVGSAGNVGVGNGANVAEAATWAIQVVLYFGGGGAQHVAAQFTFQGREYLAIDQGGSNSAFTDAQDLLLEITGATGTISANDFFG
jgi:Ca2+-binding RTX toxin-like protein